MEHCRLYSGIAEWHLHSIPCRHYIFHHQRSTCIQAKEWLKQPSIVRLKVLSLPNREGQTAMHVHGTGTMDIVTTNRILQWNLSNVDTIVTMYVCPEYGGVRISGASG